MVNTIVGRPMEILLVEDNLEDAHMTMEALVHKNLRCRVTLVCDGEEAMAFLCRQGVFARVPHPDLVLLDMEMPRKDGREVLAEIRTNEELHSIPVIVLTASLVHRAILQAQQLHVDAYMTKPVDWAQFTGAVVSLRRSWLADAIVPAMA